MSKAGDRAGREYWDRFWREGASFPASISPYSKLHNFTYRKYEKFYRGLFSGLDTGGMKLLEAGCARSVWLPYFAKEYSFDVHGIDYSPAGCMESEKIMEKEGVEAKIVNADLFDPPEYMKGSFDVVISLGVIEHFRDTFQAVGAHAEFLKPGGILVAKIPNMKGIPGFLLPAVNFDFFKTHVPLSPEDLEEACEACGLKTNECGYVPLLDIDIANSGKKLSAGENVLFSPFINCIGEKLS